MINAKIELCIKTRLLSDRTLSNLLKSGRILPAYFRKPHERIMFWSLILGSNRILLVLQTVSDIITTDHNWIFISTYKYTGEKVIVISFYYYYNNTKYLIQQNQWSKSKYFRANITESLYWHSIFSYHWYKN